MHINRKCSTCDWESITDFNYQLKHPQCIQSYAETCVTSISEVQIECFSNSLFPSLPLSLSLTGIMSATGNGYVIYMTIKRKTKLKPPELMTVNLAIFDFGISGTGLCVHLLYS